MEPKWKTENIRLKEIMKLTEYEKAYVAAQKLTEIQCELNRPDKSSNLSDELKATRNQMTNKILDDCLWLLGIYVNED